MKREEGQDVDIKQKVVKDQWMEPINEMFDLYGEGKLTKKAVEVWLNTIPVEERAQAQDELETCLSDRIENLPE